MKNRQIIGSLALLCASVSAFSAETTTYTYDELGRLVKSSNSGGPRNSKATATSYDPVGNRSGHAVGQPAPVQSDAATFSVSAQSPVAEGDIVTFTVTKSGSAGSNLSVNYATAAGTAAAPGDFDAISGTLNFRPWETIKQLDVQSRVDGASEGAEQFSLVLSSPQAGAVLGTGVATATISANGSANLPPVARSDSLSVPVCMQGSVNVIANDTDPEGNYPLTLVSVTTPAKGSTFVEDASTVGFSASADAGNWVVTYTVRDSFGVTATGSLAITVTAGQGCL